jgi:hypothetical protein
LVAYTEPQKVLGASKEPKAMRFAVRMCPVKCVSRLMRFRSASLYLACY